MKRMDHSGFTLIELLIVLAVIAVLTALLFPEFAQTRESARHATCLSNLHQIALASELYSQDFDETFLWSPPGEGTPGELASARISRQTGHQRPCVDHPRAPWDLLLKPYLKSCAVLRCPSFPVDLASASSLDAGNPSGMGYGLNAVLLGDDCQPRTVTSLRHSPSEVALIGDSAAPRSGIWVERSPAAPWPRGWGAAVTLQELTQWPGELPGSLKLTWGWQTSQALAPGWEPDLHGGGSNFAFADGHARFLRPAAKVIRLAPPTFGSLSLGTPADDRAGSFPDALLE